MPDLDFTIQSAEAPPYHATPTLLFKLALRNRESDTVRSIMLKVQVKILAAARSYDEAERQRLGELFGLPQQWARSLKSLPWMQAVVLVPAFDRETIVGVSLPCTYDFEVAGARYLFAVHGGNIPLEFLFSGTMFYDGPAGLQAAQISWDKETTYRLSATLWQEMMDHYFPNSAWLRLQKEVFDMLYNFKVQQKLPSWDAAVQQLLDDRRRPGIASNSQASNNGGLRSAVRDQNAP